MKTVFKRGTGFLLAFMLLLSLSVPAFAAETDLTAAVQGSAKYMLNTVREPQVGSVGGEWAVIGLARSGCDVPQKYWDGIPLPWPGPAPTVSSAASAMASLHPRRRSPVKS